MLAEQVFAVTAGALVSKAFGRGHQFHGPRLPVPMLDFSCDVEGIAFQNFHVPVLSHLLAIAHIRPRGQLIQHLFVYQII